MRSKRIVVLRGGFRSALCHGEDEKTITKPDGVSVVEDRCGGSVWRIGDGFESLVSFVSLRDGKHEVRGEERKKGKLKKKKTLSILLTRVYKTPIKIGNRTR